MRTSIPDVKFDNPVGSHGSTGSTAAHNEILQIIDSSLSYDDFKRRLGMWSDYRLQGGRNALPSGLNSHPVPNNK